MSKIVLEICCGTACYMLGASELMNISEMLPEEWVGHIDISAIPCLDACSDESLGKAPFVRIDGELFGNATPENVFMILRDKLSAGGII